MDSCLPRIYCPYKTKGFAPRVLYFASLPLPLQPLPPIAQSPCICISATVKFASSNPNHSMEPWCRSDITLQRLEGLVHCGLLCPLTAVEEWRLPSNEDEPSPPKGYMVSFAHFHEQGFTIPAHRFLRGLLHYYKVELQHLTPNGVQHIAVFVALCEGFLGISPHFDLWRYFFAINLLKK